MHEHPSSAGQTPWHQRWKVLGKPRNWLRGAVFALVRKLLATDDGRAMVAEALGGLLNQRPAALDGMEEVPAMPYAELGEARPGQRGAGAVFITARFRSGSTLLWNLFRNMDGFTAYYEPLNERRWFDPAHRGSRIDATHRNVSDYWTEFNGLEELGRYYREDWIRRRLFMDAHAWDPDLRAYVQVLIDRAAGRPVLQFNRIDLRLPWFRHQFPAAKLVHLYRHPRDQWCSALMDVQCFPRDGKMSDFPTHDKFYLLTWANDLRHHFPFLHEGNVSHPYELFYYIWKLSYLFGHKYAHHSIAFEDLVTEPAPELERLFAALEIDPGRHDMARLKGIIVKPALGKWKDYAEDSWFRDLEGKCETVLARFLATAAARPDTAAGLLSHANGCCAS